jgi:hypothetical protein
MNNLTKSILVVNKLLGLLIGSNFTTPSEHVLEEYPVIRYIG